MDTYITSLKIDDIYSLNILQPLLNGHPYLPFTGSSLRPFCLNYILNDIIVNNRKSIIEFGSGISTIMIGRLIKVNKLKTKLLSIEHNYDWVNVLSAILKTEGLEDVIEIQYSPLESCKLSIDNNQWYKLENLNNVTENKFFDMVIIDGPPAWEANKSKSRYPALPFIWDKLALSFSVFIDDASRLGEKNVIQLWENNFGIKFSVVGNTLGYYHKGSSYYLEPFVYYYPSD